MSINKIGLSASLLICSQALSQSLPNKFDRPDYMDIRWAARANTGISSINDGTSVFYNPGAIPLINNITFNFVDPQVGLSDSITNSYQTISKITAGGTSLDERLSPYRGSPLGGQASVFPNISAPYFVGGIWDFMENSFIYQDPIYPKATVNTRNDYGIVVGSGAKLFDSIGLGFSLRYIKRTHVYKIFTADYLLTNASTLLTNTTQKGEAFGLNLGLQARHAITKTHNFHWGVVVENAGETRFRGATRTPAPPIPQKQVISGGVSYELTSPVVDVKALFDMRYLDDQDRHWSRKVHAGIDMDLPLVEVRGGIMHGYLAFGGSLAVAPGWSLDFATYAEELGYAAGQKQGRVWMMGLRWGVELKPPQKKKRKYTLQKL